MMEAIFELLFRPLWLFFWGIRRISRAAEAGGARAQGPPSPPAESSADAWKAYMTEAQSQSGVGRIGLRGPANTRRRRLVLGCTVAGMLIGALIGAPHFLATPQSCQDLLMGSIVCLGAGIVQIFLTLAVMMLGGAIGAIAGLIVSRAGD